MCISRVSSNLFPCDSKPTSVVATSALVVAVVAGVLVAAAYALHWGTAAMYSLAATSGVGVVIALAIILLRKAEERRLVTPSESFPEVFSSINFSQTKTEENGVCLDLYALIKKGDLETFKKAVRLYDQPTLLDLGFRGSHTIVLDGNDRKTTLPTNSALTIFVIMLNQPSPLNIQFLNAFFESTPDHSVHPLFNDMASYVAWNLKNKTRDVIDILFKKFDFTLQKELCRYALEKNRENLVVVEAFFDRWLIDADLQKSCTDSDLCRYLLESPLTKELKLNYLNLIASHRKVPLDALEVKYPWFIKGTDKSFDSCNLLHFAILNAYHDRDWEFIRDLVTQAPTLLEKPLIEGSGLTLLLLACMNDMRVISKLLDIKANPNALLKDVTLFSQSRKGATQITPLMIAERTHKKFMVDLLIKAGADPDTKDGSDDGAWTMVEYQKEYEHDFSRKSQKS